MPQRSVASNYTFEQQRTEINLLAADFWTQKTAVDGASTTYLKHDGSNAFTGQTLAVPAAFTINSNGGAGTLTISGNLNVTGTTTTVNTTNLDVTDKNITIAKGNNADATADGAGITIDSATDITWNFVDANDAWVSSIGVEATTFLKGPYGQFTGSGTPTTGQGVEVNAPDGNTGQISSYDRTNSAYKELRLKGSSVGVYTGTTNALRASFNSSGLNVEAGDLKIVTDTGKVTCGQGHDLQLYHNGGSSVIQNINNNASLYLQASSTGTNNIKCNPNGSTQLFWNGVLGLYTSEDANNAGVANIRANDNVALRMGNAEDFSIFHHGTEQANYIESTNNVLYICGKTGQTAVQITPDGATDLRHSGLKKLETTTSGIDVTGNILNIDGASNDPYIYIERSGAGDAALDLGGIFWKNDTKLSALIKCRTIDRLNAELIFETMDNDARVERLRIKDDGKLMTQQAGFIFTASSAGSLTLAGGNTNLGGKIVLTGGNGDGDIKFHAQKATGTPQQRMVIKDDGKIGIGDDSPSRLMSINGDINLASGSRIESYSSGGNLIIQGGSTYPGGHIHMYGGLGDDKIEFATSGGAAPSLVRMAVTSTGNVTLGNSGHDNSQVGGEEISGQDYDATLKIYDTRDSHWLMQARSDTSTNPNGIFIRSGNASSNYTLYACGTNEEKAHLIVRGDGILGVNTKAGDFGQTNGASDFQAGSPKIGVHGSIGIMNTSGTTTDYSQLAFYRRTSDEPQGNGSHRITSTSNMGRIAWYGASNDTSFPNYAYLMQCVASGGDWWGGAARTGTLQIHNNSYEVFRWSANGVATGRSLRNVATGSGMSAWTTSGSWKVLLDLAGYPANALYMCDAAMQNLAAYTATFWVYKTANSTYQVVHDQDSLCHWRINGSQLELQQNSGADQTETFGHQKIFMSIGMDRALG